MSLISSIADFLKPTPTPTPKVLKALDLVGEIVDPLLKSAPGFERHLTPPVEHVLGYCEGVVAGLPGPIDMDRQAFSANPLVHALFATADDIDQMLGRSQAIRDCLAEPQCWESEYFYALFAARRQEKKQLGIAQQGDMLQNDVPQVVMYFCDQTLVEPHCNLEITLENLRNRGLESLLHTFHDHVEALRSERDGLRADVSMERAHLTVLRGRSPGPEFTTHTRHLAELDGKLRETVKSLMPDQILPALAAYLREPEASLGLSPVSVTVDRLGVVSDQPGDDVNVHTLKFSEIRGRDKRNYMVMLARIRRDEAQAAVELVTDQRRRFIII